MEMRNTRCGEEGRQVYIYKLMKMKREMKMPYVCLCDQDSRRLRLEMGDGGASVEVRGTEKVGEEGGSCPEGEG